MNSISLIKTGALALLSISLSACGELPGFNVNAKTDEFKQQPVRNDKIDILFMVDNSGSMADEQAILAQSFQEFISKFTDKKLDFQVGVITTDTTLSGSWWSNPNGSYKNITNAGPGSLLAYKTNERILRPSTVDVVTKFQQNSKLGTDGSGAEAGLKATTIALSEAMLGSGGYNEGFVRADAMLAVIFITDEDEARTTGSNQSSQLSYIRSYPAEAAARKAALEDRLHALKPKAELLSVTSIVAPSQAECSTVWTNGADGLLSTGDLFMETANDFKGRIIPICRDFSGPIIELGADLVKFLSRFKLKQIPDGQIRVYVNSDLVEHDDENGWAYISETNEVEFRGDAIPASDAKIEVVYVPGEPLR